MACSFPIQAWPPARPGGPVVFREQASYKGAVPFLVPCGQCMRCRLARVLDWRTRLVCEAAMHERSSFLTLTYSDEHLPFDYGLNPRHVQLFLKRLRKQLEVPIRFFAAGEYGSKTFRPHYHLLVFGEDFAADRYVWRRTPSGHMSYRSPLLEKCWPLGSSEIGTVTPQSAGYVCGYVLKKRRDAGHYQRVHPFTGELCDVMPEFIRCSNRPGIGSAWFAAYQADAFPSDFLVVDGRKVPVPAYFKRRLGASGLPWNTVKDRSTVPDAFWITAGRKEAALGRADDNTPERLAVKEELASRKHDFFSKESLED